MMLHANASALDFQANALGSGLRGLRGLGVDPGTGSGSDTDPFQAGCIGCEPGEDTSGGGGGAGTGWDEGNSPLAGCDPDLVAQGYTCAYVDGEYHYAMPVRTTTAPQPGGQGSGTGSGPGPNTGSGGGVHNAPGGNPFKPSTIVWWLLGGIALLTVGNVWRARS